MLVVIIKSIHKINLRKDQDESVDYEILCS